MTDTLDDSPYNRRQRIYIEIMLVYVGVVLPVAVLHPFRGLPFISQYLWTAAMVLQVYLPAWLFFRRGQPLAVSGLHLRRPWEGITLWLLCSSLFMPLTVGGHHIWQKWNGLDAQHITIPYRQFSFSLRGEPTQRFRSDQVQIYADMQRPEIIIRWKDPISATIRSDGMLQVIAGAQWVNGQTNTSILKFSGGTGETHPIEIRFRVGGKSVNFFFERDGHVLSRQLLRLGPDQQPFAGNTLFRDYWWILYIIVAQLFMVALPEEFFYRGYLLTRLDALFPPKTIWGIPLSWGNLICSLLFALTHFVIGWNAYRLSVFFPSLIFGMLKQRTRSLLAPILFHATSNIVIKLLEVWYF